MAGRYVFSTHVEVFPAHDKLRAGQLGLLHTRGGVSIPSLASTAHWLSSPRTWRCFLHITSPSARRIVFSTHVEVFPVDVLDTASVYCLLHARGGVSIAVPPIPYAVESSPRTWRCFCSHHQYRAADNVFSTHVEVFLNTYPKVPSVSGLLHACGGVSSRRFTRRADCLSSPRMWRCFSLTLDLQFDASVFSTHVEVFPGWRT